MALDDFTELATIAEQTNQP